MGKRGRKPKGQHNPVRKSERVGFYILRNTRARVNWQCENMGGVSQDAVITAALDLMGVPHDVPEQPQVSA